MNVAGIPLLAFLALSLAATLVVKFSPSLFVFSLFNALILAVILGSYRPPGDEVGGVWPSLQASYEVEEEDGAHDDGTNDESDDDDCCYGGECGSDGYDEDDDDNGSDDEIGWGDDEECDDNLDTRIEDFIAKVVKGWREEWLRDKLQYG